MAAAAAQAELEAAAQAEIAEAGRRAVKLQAIQQKLAAQKAASEARRAAQEAERAQVSPRPPATVITHINGTTI